jgi:hypothetical protein
MFIIIFFRILKMYNFSKIRFLFVFVIHVHTFYLTDHCYIHVVPV